MASRLPFILMTTCVCARVGSILLAQMAFPALGFWVWSIFRVQIYLYLTTYTPYLLLSSANGVCITIGSHLLSPRFPGRRAIESGGLMGIPPTPLAPSPPPPLADPPAAACLGGLWSARRDRKKHRVEMGLEARKSTGWAGWAGPLGKRRREGVSIWRSEYCTE